MAVTKETGTVYRGGKRRYLTKRAAIKAEAVAIIKAKHPNERAEIEVGFPGWNWTLLPRSDVLLRRVVRLVRDQSKA